MGAYIMYISTFYHSKNMRGFTLRLGTPRFFSRFLQLIMIASTAFLRNHFSVSIFFKAVLKNRFLRRVTNNAVLRIATIVVLVNLVGSCFQNQSPSLS